VESAKVRKREQKNKKLDDHRKGRTVAAVEISDRKDLNTLYKFRNLINVNRIIKSVSVFDVLGENRA
jgi:hypothetical protein